MKERVELKVLERFECLGERCPATCCRGWDINVDTETLAKWRAMGTDGAELLAKTRSEGERTLLALSNSDSYCLSLTDEGLCAIQVQHGHDCLAEICRQYPRVSSASAVRDLKTAQLSCPEVVRLVLFDSDEGSAFSRKGEFGGGSASLALLSPEEQAAWYLDGFVAAVLAERKFPLNVRLFLIAQKLAEMATLSAEGRLDESWFQRLKSGLRSVLYDINVRTKSRRLSPAHADGGVFWRAVYDLCVGRGIDLAELEIDDSEMIRALGQAAPTEEGFANAYDVARKWLDAGRAELRTRFPGVLERYFAVSLMNKGFPWNPAGGNFVATFLNAVLPLAVVQLILSARLAQSGELDDVYIQTVICRVEREMGHSWSLVDWLFKKPAMLRIDQYLECFLDVG